MDSPDCRHACHMPCAQTGCAVKSRFAISSHRIRQSANRTWLSSSAHGNNNRHDRASILPQTCTGNQDDGRCVGLRMGNALDVALAGTNATESTRLRPLRPRYPVRMISWNALGGERRQVIALVERQDDSVWGPGFSAGTRFSIFND
jgi:hypothetical protein